MYAKKCDRCGKYYDHYKDNKNFNSLRKFSCSSLENYTAQGYYIDLCKECRDEFIEWMCVNGSNSQM